MEALWKQGRTEWQLSVHGFSFAKIWMFAIAAWWHLPSWSGVPCFPRISICRTDSLVGKERSVWIDVHLCNTCCIPGSDLDTATGLALQAFWEAAWSKWGEF